MDNKQLFIWTFIVCSCLIQAIFSKLDDVTSDVGLSGTSGNILAAFGDFNSDKKTDIFLISNSKGKSEVKVYLWGTSDDEFEKTGNIIIQIKQAHSTNVIPADFNGDGRLDVLVAYYNTTLNNKDTFVKVFLGSNGRFEKANGIKIEEPFKDQPAIIDFDGDLHPDLLGEKKSDGKRYWWKYNDKNKTFESHYILTRSDSYISKPHSCGFLDLNNDYTPDLFIPVSKDGSSKDVEFEIWLNDEGVFKNNDINVYKPKHEKGKELILGQSTFADIDSDGLADHLLPVCYSDCSEISEIQVYSKEKQTWYIILTSGTIGDAKWHFVSDIENGDIPLMTLRIGDYNLDGYPDAAAIVNIKRLEQASVRRVVLLENVGCGGSVGCFNGRKFSINWDNHVLSTINNPFIVGFFDLYDNGILDLFVVSTNGTSGSYQTHAIKNSVFSDTCFLKVVVLGSSCFSNCPSGVIPYGVNQAGPFVKYLTTGQDGYTKQASATQLSQASYFALQPPYTVFGLGRTPNFLEQLIIGLPRSKNSPARQHTWTSIIPNSQVIIIPYPPDEPSEWKWKLLLTPSRLVFLTGGALLATCVFIGAIVALLHWKEKREDRREKQEAAHKFHFDAM